MLKNKAKIITLLVILILLISQTFIFAHDENEAVAISEEVTSISEEESQTEENSSTQSIQEQNYQKSDAYLISDNITIDKIIDGNVFAIGDTVTISSQIGGDAFICANKVIVEGNGYIFSNLFVIADTVEINGVVYDIYGITNNMTISNGYVYRDLKVMCENLNIYGTIGRNVFANTQNISFENPETNTTGMINGSLSYSSKSEITLPENVVLGDVTYTPITTTSSTDIQDYLISLGSTLALVTLLWLVALWLAPNFLEKTKSTLSNNKLFIILSGLIGLIAIPVVSIILLLIGITANVALILLTIYFILLLLAKSTHTFMMSYYIK